MIKKVKIIYKISSTISIYLQIDRILNSILFINILTTYIDYWNYTWKNYSKATYYECNYNSR